MGDSSLFLAEARVNSYCFSHSDIMSIFHTIVLVDQFIAETIKKYEKLGPLNYSHFYVGIASHKVKRLKQHRVKANYKIWDCSNEFLSREIEKYFTRYKRTRGHEGGGYNDPKYLYCYLITNKTKQ